MDFLQDCIKSCIEIKNILKACCHDELCKEEKIGFGGDRSKKIDIIAEDIFIKYLQKYGQIFSEEIGFVGASNNTKIIIDPIDGSENFISKIPYFGSSIALVKNGITQKSFIINYSNDDIFYKNGLDFKQGNLGHNYFGKPKINQNSTLGIFERSYKSKTLAKVLKELKLKYRSPGALALSLAYARNVDFVLHEGPVREFDIVAGLHMNEDLCVKKDKNFLFVSKDKQIFDKIQEKLLKDGLLL